MKRNILLVEPAYKTKFPPMGLMKISTYHKKLGDNVKFVKGINDNISYECFWDRIYISTVFTYNWKKTVETIKYYKAQVRGDLSRIYVGGIMASLMPKELWQETGIKPKIGVLNKAGALDDDNKLIVDNMIPDYSLFDNIEHNYSLINDSYFGYSTRGCPNTCKFCGVRILEPKFIEYKGIKTYVKDIAKKFGEKTNLVLFDNNILASRRFEKIINDIIELGFEKDAKFSFRNKLGHISYRKRYVDFNQGIDARLLKEKQIKLLSKISINPLRIAFDHIKYKQNYSERIELAAKYGITNLSNYVLYNHNDTPEDLWERLKINIELNKKHNLKIYSFPMKYIPLNAKDRSYISNSNWNWQFLRGVQRILNVVKGIVMPGEDFFKRAFGESSEEFVEILFMPENILMNRTKAPLPIEKDWFKQFRKLSQNEKKDLLELLCKNNTKKSLIKAASNTKNGKVKKILEYYLPQKEENETISLF